MGEWSQCVGASISTFYHVQELISLYELLCLWVLWLAVFPKFHNIYGIFNKPFSDGRTTTSLHLLPLMWNLNLSRLVSYTKFPTAANSAPLLTPLPSFRRRWRAGWRAPRGNNRQFMANSSPPSNPISSRLRASKLRFCLTLLVFDILHHMEVLFVPFDTCLSWGGDKFRWILKYKWSPVLLSF